MGSVNEFNPAIVLVGLDDTESLYHFTPLISLTNSILCSTPLNFFITSIDLSKSIRSTIAVKQAQIFS